MDPKKTLAVAQSLGMSSRLLAILAVVIPLVLTVGGALLAFYLARRKKKKPPEPKPVEVQGGPASVSGGLAPNQLRRAWLRFLAALPPNYRRSILNFEHYIVLGGPSSGKSRIIDAYSDWRRQAKEFLSSQSVDPDLQVYLGSSAVVTELPARILTDYSPKSLRALERLWAPLYRRRTPTVVVVVDVARLRDATPDEITDLAERLRGKINVLSRIRQKPIEVRLALTHLDAIDGYKEFADLCCDQAIPMRIPVEFGKDKPTAAAQVDAWLTASRGHLARGLVTMPSEGFRRAVAFVRNAPAFAPGIATLLDALFAREALSTDPVCGGLYIGRDAACLPSPLRNAADKGRGPDPRLRHLIIASGFAGAILGYLTFACVDQRSLYVKASAAMHDYEPSQVGSDGERARRAAVLDFALYRGGILTRPDFFSSARDRTRAQLSREIRDDLLIPRLRLVAKTGAVEPGAAPLGWRRALYYLALIHGDRYDGMHIRDAKWLRVWSQMTELPPDMIEDYLSVTDAAYRKAVSFDLYRVVADSRDDVSTWIAYLHDLTTAVDSGAIKVSDLKSLQARAADLLESLDSFENDQTTLGILANLDAAASVAPSPEGHHPTQLRAEYEPKFEGLLNGSDASIYAARADLKAVFAAVRAGTITVTDAPLLSTLNDRLVALEQTPDDPGNDRVFTIPLGAQQFTFDTKKWATVLRNSRVTEQILTFLHRPVTGKSIFFGPDADAQLRPVTWNADNDGTSMFTGKAEIEARYTRAAFDKYVLDPVVKTSDTVDKAAVPNDVKRSLAELVKDQVTAYADEYRRQTARFYRSFGIHAASVQELRVVLAQMVADTSPFASFLAAVDRQVGVTTGHPWLAPMDDGLADYATLHKVIDASAGAPEVQKYKEILRQLLADLGPPTAAPDSAAAAPAAPAKDAKPTLESALSPAGVLTLKSVRGEKGSYTGMVRDWIASVQIPEAQQRPFLLPTELLIGIGLREIEREVARAWNRDAMAGLPALVDKFPFNKESPDEARPEELQAFFDPVQGAFFDAFRRDFEPVSEFGDGKPFRELPAFRGRINFPPGMYATVNAVAAVSSRLYDAKGKAKSLDVRIGTVPFDHGDNTGAALTLAYLTVGETTIFNFNQKPGITPVHWDWTRELACQVGVQLTDVDSRDNKFPTPLAVEASHFSLFRLLALATEAKPTKSDPNTVVYSWNPGTDKGGGARAKFATYGDPLDVFTALARQVKAVRPDTGPLAKP
jgi:hypothetical protein